MDILTITLSPAIDKSTFVNEIVPDNKLRCDIPKYEPGGGGINVARVIKRLDGDVNALYFAGGPTGELMKELLDAEGVKQTVIKTDSWTRENFIVVDKHTGQQYRFGMPGAVITKEEASKLLGLLHSMKDFPKYVVASGSIPTGLAEGFYSELAKIVKDKGARLILDTSSAALKEGVKVGAYLIKPNLTELAELAGLEHVSALEQEDVAKAIIGTGACEIIVISMGPQGAMYATKDEIRYLPAPSIKRKSTVGAGDSMVAGMVHYLSHGKSILETVMYGIASGTAATMNSGSELCHPKDIEKLYRFMQDQKTKNRF